jgi:hypothetical protein
MTTTHPVDSTTRPCCQGIGSHAHGCTTATVPTSPLPAGADRCTEWHPSEVTIDGGQTHYRHFASKQFPAFGGVKVDTSGAQFMQNDGKEYILRDVQIVSTLKGGMTATQARQLAQAIIEAADYMEQLGVQK